MDDNTMPSSVNFLKDPLCLTDLVGNGTRFEINSNFDEGATDDIFDELNLGSDYEDDEGNPIDRSDLVSPWTKPFEELKQLMQPINEHIFKQITRKGANREGEEDGVPVNARVCIRYNAYWEGEGAPFDSSFLRGTSYSFYTGRNEVLEGLEAAVRTMNRNEEAQFVISYHLLFREMGCPPRVKRCADGLFIIQLKDFCLVGDLDADEQVAEEDRNKFGLVISKVREIHLKGLDFFGQGMLRNAVRAFEKAVDVLSFCRMVNDEEQKEQTAFLIKLYTNLAVCYIKINKPARTCIMCKEIKRLTGNNPSSKALFQEGRALMMLGEFKQSREQLKRAQRIEPQNPDITKELKALEERYSQHKQSEREIWKKALGFMTTTPDSSAAPNATPNATGNATLTRFEQEMLELMKSFNEKLTAKSFDLPPGLTENEIETVDALAKRMNMSLTISPLDENTYTLSKTN